ncbi:MAG: NADP-dependent l-serine/l-allo-threonine dehydrogenase ydfg [Microgenomates group bacterium GW2011_GWC1_37_8]|uniref:NADP-dependent l-serine/l-allo-threonine dehydrogenase ydfg n=1 Tax=Candidatus Woesebacteria bacterium GW2011_GWB1_38_8 TaxID=1618570 RepID=A0A0G0L1E6_9BACT|nr:MAG: NADP-dependent l-serine/l-allo-threonine dehydrogenase ydfg [Microgenomates group bacterium GW2011_GWC1_37_8]KKQ85778.1 MAG: NADP-dependent l-serine/l-allo-threonine dehydrogenase ydfg [Candidatus Woesebacteria bacterium GW2011_GWB1_38_8]
MNKNKTAIVTGATSGFGEATTKMLLSEGYKVYGLARREERLTKLAENPNFIGYKIDLKDRDSIAKFFDSIKDVEVKLLINNAGLALNSAPYDQMDLEDVDTMIETNIVSLVHMTRYFLNLNGENKYIINLGSIAGSYAYPNNNIYGGTKAFVNHFSKNLRSDLVNKNVRVTSIEPGLAKTEFSIIRLKNDKDKAEAIYKNTEYIRPEDIALIIKNLIQLPNHLNINSIEVMPTTQAWGSLLIHRSE